MGKGVSRMVSRFGLNSEEESSVEKLLQEDIRVSVSIMLSSSSSSSNITSPPSLLKSPLSAEEVLARSLAGGALFFFPRRFFLDGGGGGGKANIFLSWSESPEAQALFFLRRGV